MLFVSQIVQRRPRTRSIRRETFIRARRVLRRTIEGVSRARRALDPRGAFPESNERSCGVARPRPSPASCARRSARLNSVTSRRGHSRRQTRRRSPEEGRDRDGRTGACRGQSCAKRRRRAGKARQTREAREAEAHLDRGAEDHGDRAPRARSLLADLVRFDPAALRVHPRLGADASERRRSPGVFGWIQSAVREQPVPVGIVCFTLFEMALWAVRHQLPLSKHAHPPLRADLPPKLRGPFERAPALLDEAEPIQTLNEKAIVRELSAKERTSCSPTRSRRCALDADRALRRGRLRRRARQRRRRGRRSPRALAQERGARVRRVDPRRRRRRAPPPRVRRRGLQDPAAR